MWTIIIVKKAGKRIYMLYQLKRAGVNQADLVTIYILSVVIPVVEYVCPVWSTNLPVYLSDNIEIIQKRAVRANFPGMIYDDILTQINLSTLKDRLDYLCKKNYINIQARSHKVNCLLPEKRHVDHDLRRGNTPTTCYSYKWIQQFLNTMGIIPLAVISYIQWQRNVRTVRNV